MYELPQDPAYEGLSIQGRFGRVSYLAWHILLAITLLILMATAWLIAPDLFPPTALVWDSSIVIALFVLFVAQLGTLYFHIIFTIRRLNDCNLTAWWAVLCLIPFANWLLAFYLVFKPGISEKNQYGTPRQTLLWEVGLVYLTGTLIILGSIIWILFAN
jgi:uncharacterized membrane protein YhaH (DUF805 family)